MGRVTDPLGAVAAFLVDLWESRPACCVLSSGAESPRSLRPACRTRALAAAIPGLRN
jgi:hypothetical protein